jgi:hypothetical protein
MPGGSVSATTSLSVYLFICEWGIISLLVSTRSHLHRFLRHSILKKLSAARENRRTVLRDEDEKARAVLKKITGNVRNVRAARKCPAQARLTYRTCYSLLGRSGARHRRGLGGRSADFDRQIQHLLVAENRQRHGAPHLGQADHID